jgi:hypothetical protein
MVSDDSVSRESAYNLHYHQGWYLMIVFQEKVHTTCNSSTPTTTPSQNEDLMDKTKQSSEEIIASSLSYISFQQDIWKVSYLKSL